MRSSLTYINEGSRLKTADNISAESVEICGSLIEFWCYMLKTARDIEVKQSNEVSI